MSSVQVIVVEPAVLEFWPAFWSLLVLANIVPGMIAATVAGDWIWERQHRHMSIAYGLFVGYFWFVAIPWLWWRLSKCDGSTPLGESTP